MCLFSCAADHAYATFHTCRLHYASRGDSETASFSCLPGCIFPAERVLQAAAGRGLIHVPLLSSAPTLFIHLVSLSSFAFLPTCRSVTPCALEWSLLFHLFSQFELSSCSTFVSLSPHCFSFSFQAPSNSEGYKIN